MILVIDNYDSFVHNLARYVRELGGEAVVRRNDALTLDEIAALAPSHILLSPGPCTPREAGISVDLDPALRADDANPRRMPRSPVHWRGLWRDYRARGPAGAWQDIDHHAHGHRGLRGLAVAAGGGALSLARDCAGVAPR